MTDKLIIEVDAKTIYDSLKSLENKVDKIIRHQVLTNGRVTKNEKKIRKLENTHLKQAGFIAGVVAVVQIIINYI